jgi:hypothetical protein
MVMLTCNRQQKGESRSLQPATGFTTQSAPRRSASSFFQILLLLLILAAVPLGRQRESPVRIFSGSPFIYKQSIVLLKFPLAVSACALAAWLLKSCKPQRSRTLPSGPNWNTPPRRRFPNRLSPPPCSQTFSTHSKSSSAPPCRTWSKSSCRPPSCRLRSLSETTSYDTQHRALETVVTSERSRAAQLEAEQAIIKQDIQTLRAALAVSERAPAGPPGTSSVVDTVPRLVDGSLVRVTTNNLIALEEISATLHEWIQGAGIAKEFYDIRGGELSN